MFWKCQYLDILSFAMIMTSMLNVLHIESKDEIMQRNLPIYLSIDKRMKSKNKSFALAKNDARTDPQQEYFQNGLTEIFLGMLPHVFFYYKPLNKKPRATEAKKLRILFGVPTD